MTKSNFDSLMSYIAAALQSFVNDPADSSYQRGYEAALQDVYDYGVIIDDEE